MRDDAAGDRPGSDGEHDLQEFGTKARALAFYDGSMHDRLNAVMTAFVHERMMFFLATADSEGNTDCSPRIGPRGFVTVLDDTHLAYPEFRGDGVQASLGNIRENPHATLLFVDSWGTTVGLHVNGRGRAPRGKSRGRTNQPTRDARRHGRTRNRGGLHPLREAYFPTGHRIVDRRGAPTTRRPSEPASSRTRTEFVVGQNRGFYAEPRYRTPMQLSVVVPTLNARRRLVACLDALAAAAPGSEVVVVNGPSADSTTGTVRERDDVDVLVEVADRNVNVMRKAGNRTRDRRPGGVRRAGPNGRTGLAGGSRRRVRRRAGLSPRPHNRRGQPVPRGLDHRRGHRSRPYRPTTWFLKPGPSLDEP